MTIVGKPYERCSVSYLDGLAAGKAEALDRIASLEAQLEKAETALNFYRNRSNHGSGFINEKPAGKIAFEYFAEKEKNGK